MTCFVPLGAEFLSTQGSELSITCAQEICELFPAMYALFSPFEVASVVLEEVQRLVPDIQVRELGI